MQAVVRVCAVSKLWCLEPSFQGDGGAWVMMCAVSRDEQRPRQRPLVAASEEPTWNEQSRFKLFNCREIHWVCHWIFPSNWTWIFFCGKVDRLAYILIQPGGWRRDRGGRSTFGNVEPRMASFSSISCSLRLKLPSQNRCFYFLNIIHSRYFTKFDKKNTYIHTHIYVYMYVSVCIYLYIYIFLWSKSFR